MATQSLYRRYRPRRFSEVKGQQHVVRALRDAVAAGREGQAYLFSGPRGTGKTTTARILAKVLNCESVENGEPCCECDSCLAVQAGNSYDVHELDAASNNGVDSIRDLIEKASLGTPGRHRVYILDEVHMLSKGAEAALLKTLEEPPPHVVFVLATTDPQKMSETIRSRTQHLQFHLLPSDELSQHVRWVAEDAGLELSNEAFEAALARGGGSARDTLSALELLVATGGEVGDAADLDAFLRALIERDAGAALAALAAAVALGLDPRAITEDLIRHLRNGFLSLMAPDLVIMAPDRLAVLTEQAREFGAPGLVRSIERLGTTLADMRNAPDPRVLVEVTLVQLTHAEVADIGALEARVAQLEQQLAAVKQAATSAGGGPATAGTSTANTATSNTAASSNAAPAESAPKRPDSSPPVDPQTGRRVLGGAVQQARAAASRAKANASAGVYNAKLDQAAASEPDQAAASEPQQSAPSEPQPEPKPAATDATGADTDSSATAAAPAAEPTPEPKPKTTGPGTATVDWAAVWDTQIRDKVRPLTRALFASGEFTTVNDKPTLVVTTSTQVAKCSECKQEVEQAFSTATGATVEVDIVLRDESTRDAATSSGSSSDSSGAKRYDDEGSIDMSELTDVPPESVKTPLDHLAEAFPGSEMVEE